jgi:hypothetical protein
LVFGVHLVFIALISGEKLRITMQRRMSKSEAIPNKIKRGTAS